MASNLADKLMKRFAKMDQLSLEIGIVGENATKPHPNGNGLTIGEVAHIVTFGSADGKIPARDFLRYTAAVRRKNIANVTSAAVKAVTEGRSSVERALGLVGVYVAGQIQETIARDKVPPPNAPSTIAKKGSSTPLIDSGVMRTAISWKIVNRG